MEPSATTTILRHQRRIFRRQWRSDEIGVRLNTRTDIATSEARKEGKTISASADLSGTLTDSEENNDILALLQNVARRKNSPQT